MSRTSNQKWSGERISQFDQALLKLWWHACFGNARRPAAKFLLTFSNQIKHIARMGGSACTLQLPLCTATELDMAVGKRVDLVLVQSTQK